MPSFNAGYRAVITALCRWSCRRPALWLALSLLLCLPAVPGVLKIRIDSDLVRLLPQQSIAARWTRQLGPLVGDGGYFEALLEGDPSPDLEQATAELASRISRIEGLASVTRENPVEFIRRYGYLLISPRQLRQVLDYVIELQARSNPLLVDLVGEPTAGNAEDRQKQAKREKDVRQLLTRAGKVSRYHESEDGRIKGIFVRPAAGVTDLEANRGIQRRIAAAAAEIAARYRLDYSVRGGMVENLREYQTIVADVQRAGLISGGAILLLLVLSFGSLRVLPVLLYPLGVGLVWAYGLVPAVVGDLNLITAFLLMVLFGIGIEFSIHILKRFQRELLVRPPAEALTESMVSTGGSVVSSGLTTSLPLFILAFLDFKGFSEFGLIGGGSILVVLLAIFLILPPAMSLGHRLGLVRPASEPAGRGWLPPPAFSLALLACIVIAAGLAATRIRFDYDFNNLRMPQPPDIAEHRRRGREVYGGSYAPSAVYVAPDVASLDAARRVLTQAIARAPKLYEKTGSLRDYALTPEDFAERLALLAEIRAEVRGDWTSRVEDEHIRSRIRDFLAWESPSAPPGIEELPTSIQRGLFTRDGTRRPVIGVWAEGSGRDGLFAMNFTEDLYRLPMSAEILGPLGEMPVFAEILWLVKREGPRVVAVTLAGIAFLVYLSCRSAPGMLLVMFPLLGGMVLSLGIMALTGMKLNFFNVVAIPAVLGMAVDNGVHYYHRWRELGRDPGAVQGELLGPVSVCTLTNMLGYLGLLFTTHPGLRSLGQVACLGMLCLWVTSVLLLPGLLALRRPRSSTG